MSERHILSLELPPVANAKILSVKDTSQYADNLAVECAELMILPPGYTIPQIIEVKAGFNLNLNTCSLGMSDSPNNNCYQTLDFPDGIYAIKYRIQPHAKVYVEYNFLRVNKILEKYYNKLHDIDISPSEPSSTQKKLLADMSYIRTMIDAAKAKVEYASSPDEGWELYNFANKKLDKITDVSC